MRMSRRTRLLVVFIATSAGLLVIFKFTGSRTTSGARNGLIPRFQPDHGITAKIAGNTEEKETKLKTDPKRELRINITREATATAAKDFRREITKDCKPKFDPSNIKTPFKFFIYDLPPMYNKNIIKCKDSKGSCYDLNYCGTGEELYRFHGDRLTFATASALQFSQFLNSKMKNQIKQGYNVTSKAVKMNSSYSLSIRNTHMFSLEVIIHYKLLHSPFRTLDPTKADMFYLPFYSGLMCECDRKKVPKLVQNFFMYLDTLPYFKDGKPHFSTMAKIQREQTSEECSMLRHPRSANITFIAIEKESNPSWNDISYVFGKSILVAPYPAYIHFINDVVQKLKLSADNENETHFRLSVPSIDERNVFLFLGCGSRRSNNFRNLIIDQFAVQTIDDYEKFVQENNVTNIEQIMLITQECSIHHRYTTIPWMMRSIFCLQPPGDSPTRKSFYDSILSGCIPITFKLKHPMELPFSDKLNYEEFTFTIDEKLIYKPNKTLIEIVKGIPQEKIDFLHANVLRVAKWFQYSMPDGGPQYDNDAVTLILDQLQQLYKL